MIHWLIDRFQWHINSSIVLWQDFRESCPSKIHIYILCSFFKCFYTWSNRIRTNFRQIYLSHRLCIDCTTKVGQSGSGSNVNEQALCTSQIFKLTFRISLLSYPGEPLVFIFYYVLQSFTPRQGVPATYCKSPLTERKICGVPRCSVFGKSIYSEKTRSLICL